MEAAGAALAIFSATDLCFKYGKILVETCITFRGAEAEINERVLCVESYWKRTSMQLDFINQIWTQMDAEHQSIQTQILQVLVSKMTIIITKLENLSKKRSRASAKQIVDIKRWKYVITKDCLDEAIDSLTSWQRMFDPSWFLMLRVSSPLIDDELDKNNLAISSFTSGSKLRDAMREQPRQKLSVFLPKDGLDIEQARDIPFCTAKTMQRAGSGQRFVIDGIPCHAALDPSLITRNVRELARKLMSVDPFTFGILQCKGVLRVLYPGSVKPASFDFVFKIPPELSGEPESLRSYLSSGVNLTLSARFELAKQVAKSISYVHTLDFVHKNIRPETILGFHKGSSSHSFFLIGFENMRTADGRTLQSGDSDWEKNLYRHPRRQGSAPQDIYTMQHDIYSLGVCLLEIGLWESFISFEKSETIPLPSAALGVATETPAFEQPTLMKEHLTALAQQNLPQRMGDKYEKIVVNCLTCLDHENPDFGNQREFEDEDGVLIGVNYIRKILLKLEETLV